MWQSFYTFSNLSTDWQLSPETNSKLFRIKNTTSGRGRYFYALICLAKQTGSTVEYYLIKKLFPQPEIVLYWGGTLAIYDSWRLAIKFQFDSNEHSLWGVEVWAWEGTVEEQGSFLSLNDTPNSFSGMGGKVLTVKEDETTLQFSPASELDLGLPSFGTGAFLNAGTNPDNLVQLNAQGKLPALDGANLFNLPISGQAGMSLVFRAKRSTVPNFGMPFGWSNILLDILSGWNGTRYTFKQSGNYLIFLYCYYDRLQESGASIDVSSSTTGYSDGSAVWGNIQYFVCTACFEVQQQYYLTITIGSSKGVGFHKDLECFIYKI